MHRVVEQPSSPAGWGHMLASILGNLCTKHLEATGATSSIHTGHCSLE